MYKSAVISSTNCSVSDEERLLLSLYLNNGYCFKCLKEASPTVDKKLAGTK
jgi:hypothetical protein